MNNDAQGALEQCQWDETIRSAVNNMEQPVNIIRKFQLTLKIELPYKSGNIVLICKFLLRT